MVDFVPLITFGSQQERNLSVPEFTAQMFNAYNMMDFPILLHGCHLATYIIFKVRLFSREAQKQMLIVQQKNFYDLIMAIYFGLNKLQTYISSQAEPDFDAFVHENKNNIAIWSACNNCASAVNLFSLWKGRFQKVWNADPVKKKKRCPKITLDNTLTLWQSIERMVEQIKLTKDEYEVQAMTVLRNMSSSSSKVLIKAMEQEVTPLNVKSSRVAVSPGEQPTSSSENHENASPSSEIDFRIHNTIHLPSVHDRYKIEQFDVSLAFYAFQIISANNFNTLNIESNVSHILALSSIFLIQNNKWHPDLISVFTEEKLEQIFDNHCKLYGIRKYICKNVGNTKTLTDIIKVLKDFKNGKITREEGIVKTYTLGFSPSPLSVSTTAANTSSPSPSTSSIPLPRNVNKLLKCVAKLIEKLPNQDVKEDVLEFELCQRYIDPILSGLFDDPDKGIMFRWTSITNEESGHGCITKQRPDSVTPQLDGLYHGTSLGFVEVKSAKKGNNKFAISNDLIRLGILSKNALDKSNANGCLVVQVIGLNIDFFITKLKKDGLYTMFDLYSIKAPTSKESIQGFVSYFDELLAILDIFNEHCLIYTLDESRNRLKRKALPDEAFDDILSRTKSSARKCYTS